jgi:hypothetical protein
MPRIEEGKVSSMWPDEPARLFDGLTAFGARVTRDHQFAPCLVIAEEEKAGQGIRVDMTLESHGLPALNVEDNAVTIVDRSLDGLGPGLIREVEELVMIELVEPGELLPDLVGVYPATVDARDVLRLTGQRRGLRELAKVGVDGYRADILLPVVREQVGYVEGNPPKS